MQKRLNDLKDCFLNSDYLSNPVIYQTDDVFPFSKEDTKLFTSITTIFPGDINGEYYMTRGHYHANKTEEIYYGIEGTGILLEESITGTVAHTIAPGVFIQTNGESAHRLINNSNHILKVVCVCRADTTPCYNFTFSQRFIRN